MKKNIILPFSILLCCSFFIAFIFCINGNTAVSPHANKYHKQLVTNTYVPQINKNNIASDIIDSKIATQPTTIPIHKETEQPINIFNSNENDNKDTGISMNEPGENQKNTEYKKEKTLQNNQKHNDNVQDKESLLSQPNNNFPNIDFSNQLPLSNIPNFQKSNIVAYITCSSIGLQRIPIVYGWDQYIVDNNEIALSEYSGKAFGQNMSSFMCGHNNKSLQYLSNINIGDKILIETTYGANFLYEVTKSKKVQMSGCNFIDMDSGQNILNYSEETNDIGIFTCINGCSLDYRWFVKAKQINGTTFY